MKKLQPENEREALLMLQATAQTAQTMLTCIEVAPLHAAELCELLITNYQRASSQSSDAR